MHSSTILFSHLTVSCCPVNQRSVDCVSPEPDDTNFEDGWGIWEQGTSDDFDWELRTGGTPTLRTGPKKDHTTGDGKALFKVFINI